MLPPAQWFDGISHVVVVPDGILALVPFDLLSVGDRLVVQRAAVTYTPSAATLLRAAPGGFRWRAPWHLQLEAFADPIVRSAALDDLARIRTRLEASAGEVRMLADQLRGASRLHIGSENRKASLQQPAGARPPLLHIASHAFADPNGLEGSRIMFSPGDDSGADADYLFLREAYALELGGVELAVLSACDTARGRLAPAEGIESFSRAFLAAGARSTVTTLWRVADEPTADFMAVFYHHLQSGLTRDEALRRAKLRFLESDTALADPHYWAAFVLTGDGLRPVPRAIGWWMLAAFVVVPIVAVVWIVNRLRPRAVRRTDSVPA
jgi:CHAT domain-containing protein